MIAALLLKYGIPSWLTKLAAGAALALGLWAGVAWHDRVVFNRGVAQESARRDQIELANEAKAMAERNRINVKLAATQAELNIAIANLSQLQTELDHEKQVSSQRQADLLAGRERLRVLVRATSQADPAGHAQGAPAAAVDSGTEVIADLAGTTASAIDQLRTEHNEAVVRLNACIQAYDAVQAAAKP